MRKRKESEVKKITDLKDKLDAYRSSALAAGKGPARTGNLGLASAAAGGAALAITPAAEAVIVHSGPQSISVTNAQTFINMDSDGADEFAISHSSYVAKASPGTAYASILANPFLGSFVKALSANYSIANTVISGPTFAGWTDGNRFLGFTSTGPFPSAGNK